MSAVVAVQSGGGGAAGDDRVDGFGDQPVAPAPHELRTGAFTDGSFFGVSADSSTTSIITHALSGPIPRRVSNLGV
jgi:hypothetical protein